MSDCSSKISTLGVWLGNLRNKKKNELNEEVNSV